MLHAQYLLLLCLDEGLCSAACKHVSQRTSSPVSTFVFVSDRSVLGNLPFTDTAALPNATGSANVLTCSGNCSEVAYLFMVQGKTLQASWSPRCCSPCTASMPF